MYVVGDNKCMLLCTIVHVIENVTMYYTLCHSYASLITRGEVDRTVAVDYGMEGQAIMQKNGIGVTSRKAAACLCCSASCQYISASSP